MPESLAARCFTRSCQAVRPRIARAMCGLAAVLLILGGCSTPESRPTPTPSPAAPAADAAQVAAEAAAAYTAKDWANAERLHVMLTRGQPEDAETWFRLGNIYARTERPALAVRAFEAAIERDDRHARAWHNLGIVRMRLAVQAFARLAEVSAADDPLRVRGATIEEGLQQLLQTAAPAAPAR